MKKPPSLATLEEDFANIEKLLKTVRIGIADIAEGVRIAARDSRPVRKASMRPKASSESALGSP